MINNRQNGNGNGRRRGRAGNAPRPNGGGGQADRGSRLDNRARGNASQLHEKYKTLAADMQRQGDRVMTEYYLQFADHYFRVLSETRARFEDQQPRRDRFDAQSDEFDDGEAGDGDGYDERPPERGQRAPEWDRNDEGQRPRQDRGDEGQRVRQDRGDESQRPRQDRGDEGQRPRQDRGDESQRPRQDRGDDGQRYRQDRGDEGQRVRQDRDGNRGEGGDAGREPGRADAGRDRQEQDGERRPREARGTRESFEQRPRLRRAERPDGERQPVAPTEERAPEPAPASTAPVVAVEAELPLEAPVPERRPRGRPRKVVAPVESVADGEASERIEMDRLPPALSETIADGDAPVEPKARRTRRPRGETAGA